MNWKRTLVLVLAAAASFTAAAVVLLRFLPQPHTQIDYLIVGTASTLVMLVVLFVAAIAFFRSARGA